MRALYTLLLYLLMPLILLRLLWRGFALRDYRRRWGERFGFVPRAAAPVAVWVHAVSVGESLAAAPLVRALLQAHGPRSVWMTTMTPTGSARVRALFGDSVLHSYIPYDLPGAVARALARVQPRQIVVMETELWPNLFRAAARRGLRLTIANARLSPRSFAGYRRVAGFARETLANTSCVAAQSDADAERFRALGAPRVQTMGNIKFDFEPPPSQREAGRALREKLGTRPVWAAVSTHEGEELAALDAHREVLSRHADAALILVPRHPQRFAAVWKLIERQGWPMARRSYQNASQQTCVLLGDSMGEMYAYLEAADVVFVGGSLAPVGGHNVLEPAALAKPVLFGPQMHNFLPARELLLGADAATELSHAAQLGPAVCKLFEDDARRQQMGAAGSATVAANRGALARLLKLIDGAA